MRTFQKITKGHVIQVFDQHGNLLEQEFVQNEESPVYLNENDMEISPDEAMQNTSCDMQMLQPVSEQWRCSGC